MQPVVVCLTNIVFNGILFSERLYEAFDECCSEISKRFGQSTHLYMHALRSAGYLTADEITGIEAETRENQVGAALFSTEHINTITSTPVQSLELLAIIVTGKLLSNLKIITEQTKKCKREYCAQKQTNNILCVCVCLHIHVLNLRLLKIAETARNKYTNHIQVHKNFLS